MNNQKALTKEQIKQVGYWDNGRFYIHPYYHTSTSRACRSPYRNWLYSELKHVITSEYYASLSEDQLATLNKVYIGIGI